MAEVVEGRAAPTRRYWLKGRPTGYRVAHCETAAAWLAQGYSLGSLAGQLGVSSDTLLNWMKRYPEFKEAVACGRAKGLTVWEQRLAEAARKKTSCIMFALRNLSPADWGDGRLRLPGLPEAAGAEPHRVIVEFVKPPAAGEGEGEG